MVKQTEKVTLNIPYSEEDIENRKRKLESTKRLAAFGKALPYVGLGLGLATTGAGALTPYMPTGIRASLLTAGTIANTLALNDLIRGITRKQLDKALEGDKNSLNAFINKVRKYNGLVPEEYSLKALENMRNRQDSWIQPKAYRDHWKKVLKAYDEQIGKK